MHAEPDTTNARNRIDGYLDQATSGLAADPELRLEVRAELAAHIEAAASARQRAGADEAKAIEDALAATGVPEALRAAWAPVAAARRRRRRIVRVASVALVLAAALVSACCAGWVGGRLTAARDGLVALARLSPASARAWQSAPADGRATPDALARLEPDARFFFTGDLDRSTEAERQLSIWERFPRSRVYYGHYISTLCLQPPADPQILVRALRRALVLDPENSRYRYLLAHALATGACEWESHRGAGAVDTVELQVHDEALLEAAMVELLEGHRRRAYRRYALELLRVRLALLPALDRVEDLAERTLFVAGQGQPDTVVLRELAELSDAVAERWAAAGRTGEAMRLLGTWRQFARRLNEDAFTWVDAATVDALARGGARRTAATLERLGLPEHARAHRLQAMRVRDIIGAEEQVSHRVEAAYYETVQRSGSLYARLLTPMAGLPPYPPLVHVGVGGEPFSVRNAGIVVPAGALPFDATRLAGQRGAEQALLDQAGLCLLACLLALGALGAAGVGAVARAPLLSARWAQGMRLVALGVAVPLLAFFAYTRGLPFAGRDAGVGTHGVRFVAEWLALCATLALVLGHGLAHVWRRRLAELRLAVAPVAPVWRVAVEGAALTVLWGVAVTSGRGSPAWGGWAAIAVVALGGASVLARAMGWRRCGASAAVALRSSAPLLAGAALLALACLPLLRREEAARLRGEELFHWSGPDGFANAEYRSVQGVRLRVRAELAGLDV